MSIDYNSHRLFRWNEDNILLNNDTNKYSNIYLHTGSYDANNFEWQNSLCFTYKEHELNIISNSNHFLHIHDYKSLFAPYIYNQIVRNYYETIYYCNNSENKIRNILDPSKIYFYMIDSFAFSNSGHNMSVLLDQVHYIISNNIKDILILNNLENTNNFKLIKLLLPSDCIFHELEFNKIYEILNIIIIYPEGYNIYKHSNIIDNLRSIVYKNYNHIYKDCLDKNIILIKHGYKKGNPISTIKNLECDNLISYFETKGWIFINMNSIDIFKLCIYLLNAKNIVCSDGSIVYTNKLFFNKEANIFNLKDKYMYNSNFKLPNDFKKYCYITFDNYNLNINNEYIKIIDIIESNLSSFHTLDNTRLSHSSGVETYIDANRPYGSYVETFEEALEICKYNKNCKQIVYNKKTKLCYPMTLFQSNDTISNSEQKYENNDNEWISAYRYDISNSIIYNNLSVFHTLDNTRLSHTIGVQTYIDKNRPYGTYVETFEEALGVCKYNKNCKQIVYNKKTKLCFPMTLFQSNDTIPKSEQKYENNDNDWISAYRYDISIKVAIIIPTYNRFHLLKKSLESALNQTYKNIDIYITDDNSHLDILEQNKYIIEMQEKYNNIKYINNKTNNGFCKNINIALKCVTSEYNYFHILFDDDWIEPEFIETAVNIFEKYNNISFIEFNAFNHNHDRITDYTPFYSGLTNMKYFMDELTYYDDFNKCTVIRPCVSPCNRVFKNMGILFDENTIGNIDDKCLLTGSGYDFIFIYKHLKIHKNFYYSEKPLCNFLSHDGSETVRNLKIVIDNTLKGIQWCVNDYKKL